MQDAVPTSYVEFHGISPWEVAVMHEYLSAMFRTKETEIPIDELHVPSYMHIRLPVAFSDEFFEWFTFKRWSKVKALLKEMKRRRGGGAGGLEVRLDFEVEPAVLFVIDSDDRGAFDDAVEKLDYVLESLSSHLEERPRGPMTYRFDLRTRRWALQAHV